MNRKALQVFLTTFYMSLCATIFAQGLPCNDQLNIAVDYDNCDALISPELMMEGEFDEGIYQVAIKVKNPGPSAPYTQTQLNSALTYGADSADVVVNTSLIPGFKMAGMTTVEVHIIESANGNSCWGDVMLEAKMPALLIGPDDITISCLYDKVYETNPDNAVVTGAPYIDIVIGHPKALPYPSQGTGIVTIDPNSCIYGEVTFGDIVTTTPCPGTGDVRVTNIERIFTVTTPKGKISYDTQNITIENISGQVAGPQSPIIVDCTVADEDLTPAYIADFYDIDTAGYPYVAMDDGSYEILKDGEAKCNVVSTYDDGTHIKACKDCAESQGTYKFVRTWTILDWCTGAVIYRTQAIKKIDDEAPRIRRDRYQREYTTAWACGQDIDIWATARDRCDENASIIDVVGYYRIGLDTTQEYAFPEADIIPASEFVPHGENGHYTVKNLGVGITWIKWIASDCCGNTSERFSIIHVVDNTPPVAIVKQNLVISLTESGLDEDDPHYSGPGAAKLYAHHINNGSYDNCTDVRLEIRREHDAPRCGNFGEWDSSIDDYHNNNITFDDEDDSYSHSLDLEDSEYDTDKGEFVKFCCEDVGSEHKVWLRVWDEAEHYNNYNETWAYVKVEDKNVPQIWGEDDYVYCYDDIPWIYSSEEWKEIEPGSLDAFPGDLDHGGVYAPEIHNTLCGAYILEYKDTGLDLNSCNVGYWIRQYRLLNPDGTEAMDRNWNPITWDQEVHVHDSNSDIHFHWPSQTTEIDGENVTTYGEGWDKYGPKGKGSSRLYADDDYYYHLPAELYPWSGCELTEDDVVKPEVEGIICDVLGRKITIEEYEVGQGQGCKKWFVRYDYINWCVECDDSSSSGEQGTATEEGKKRSNYGHIGECRNDGLYHVARFNTVYKFEDTVDPEVTGDSATGSIDASCHASVTLSPSASDNIECNVDLRWTVTVTHDNDNDGEFELWDIYESEGLTPVFTINDLYPGDYNVLYEVLDACDNLGKDTGTIWIDGKAPTPYCISLHSAVMVDGSVTLWANDFDKGSFANCEQDDDLYFTFNEADNAPARPNFDLAGQDHYFHGLGEIYDDVDGYAVEDDLAGLAAFEAGEAQLWIAADGTSGYYFSCNNLDISSPIPVGMRVWDADFFFNDKVDNVFYSDFCSVSLSLIDNQGGCGVDPIGGTVMGSVRTMSGEGVDNVNAKLSASLPEYPLFANTANGAYSFTNLPKGVEFEVSASKVDAYENGASTIDLVIIQRHILGLAKLDSEYKMIAADINNDEQIKVSDLVDLRKVVLGTSNDFLNESWRFVVEDQLLDANHPFPYAEVAGVYANDNASFIAVKIGDVSGDAVVNANSSVVKPRSANTVTFVSADKMVEAGELVEFAVTAENFKEVYGYQFTASLNGLTVEGIQSGAIDMASENIGTPSANALTMSWTKATGATVSADDVLFTLNLRAESAGRLSSMINMNSSVTAAEAYTGENLEYANTELEVRGQVSGEFELHQNEPNPFKDVTTISFNMPSAANASLKVYDVTGKVLMTKNIAAIKGLNTENVTSADINAATGVLYYQVESGEFTATKKMIILE